MCNRWCLEFSKRALPHLGSPTRMLEVGSLDVNGTVRAVLGHAVSSYYGVDIAAVLEHDLHRGRTVPHVSRAPPPPCRSSTT